MKSNTRRNVPKLARTSITIPAPLYIEGRRMASRDLRTFSNYVSALVQSDLQTRGVLALRAEEIAA